MKLSYYDTQLLIEALNDISQKYSKDIADVCDKNGVVRCDVPQDYAPNISRKKSVVEGVIKLIKNGTVKF